MDFNKLNFLKKTLFKDLMHNKLQIYSLQNTKIQICTLLKIFHKTKS